MWQRRGRLCVAESSGAQAPGQALGRQLIRKKTTGLLEFHLFSPILTHGVCWILALGRAEPAVGASEAGEEILGGALGMRAT